MKPDRWTIASKLQGLAILLVAVAAVVVAIVNPGSSSDANASTQPAGTLGREICLGFRHATIGQYHETAASLPRLTAEVSTLSASSQWAPVASALTRLVDLGPSTQWDATTRDRAVATIKNVRVACRPLLK